MLFLQMLQFFILKVESVNFHFVACIYHLNERATTDTAIMAQIQLVTILKYCILITTALFVP